MRLLNFAIERGGERTVFMPDLRRRLALAPAAAYRAITWFIFWFACWVAGWSLFLLLCR